MNPIFSNILLIFVTFYLMSASYLKINKSIFITPLVMPQLTFIISFYTVISLYKEGYIENKVFLIILSQFIIFFIVYSISPLLIKKRFFNFSYYVHIKKIDFQMTKFLFYSNLLIGLIYASLLWGRYSYGDERLLLNRELRSLSIVTMLFNTWAVSMISLVYAKTGIKRYFIYFIATLAISSIMGSKGGALASLFIFAFFYFQFNEIKLKNKLIFSAAILISLFLPTYLTYGVDFVQIIAHRVLMAGDIYFLSFKIGDYSQLVGYYDPFMYLIHPFSALIGIRGYEYPLGAQILSTAGMPVSGMGPNAHMTILSLVFFNDGAASAILFALFVAFLSIVSFLFAFYVMRRTKIHLLFRLLIFTMLYTNFMTPFVDIGMYQFQIIILLLASFIYFILLLLIKSSTKHTEEVQCNAS